MDLKEKIAGSGRVAMLAAAMIVPIIVAMLAAHAFAEVGETDVPATSVVPAAPAAAGAAELPAASASPSAAPARKKAAAPTFKFNPRDVEPGTARAKLTEDTWAYTEPAESSKHVERVIKDKYVIVTGSTRYFLQVKLKSGKTAYVEQSAVDLVKPTDKMFKLTKNAAVLDKPNRWGKKLAEVHTPHDVHVVGIALGYVKIRMKSGLEGFIPTSAME
ncbi:MAG TPA: hypothetical protein VMV27_13505 [Candidatus Binataceae bacterium]|nr:hypothetical protein [Candidatus Binataceae bacterium]